MESSHREVISNQASNSESCEQKGVEQSAPFCFGCIVIGDAKAEAFSVKVVPSSRRTNRTVAGAQCGTANLCCGRYYWRLFA